MIRLMGSAKRCFDDPSALPKRLGSRQLDVTSAVQNSDWAGVEDDLNWAKRGTNRHILTINDERYPPLLRECGAPPVVLFVIGEPAVLARPQVAVVGTRKPTPGGAQTAEYLAGELAARGWTITSGLALGIDGYAHQGALRSGGTTIAVLAHGLDRVYPPRHQSLARNIIEQGGAIVSEFHINEKPLKANFPRRNRIIAGLTLGTLVVEAAENSGSLITARYALEEGREVFAVPGSIYNPQARGCHVLLKQGAKLVERADDIAEEIGAMVPPPLSNRGERERHQTMEPDLRGESHLVFNYLGYDPTPVDNLIERTGLAAEQVSSALLELELQGLVTAISGGLYTRRV